MITTDNDYSYIEVFINFLKEIIGMIQALFAGLNVKTGEPLPEKETTTVE